MPRGLGLALRVLLLVVGVVVLAAGATASVLVGPDDTAETGPHDVYTPGVAVLTDAEALHYVGPTLHLTVERDDGGPVFLGVAHEVDAASYVSGSSRRVISRVGLPWSPSASETGSGTTALPPPADQPWWIDSVTGSGAQELVWPIPHGRYAIVALNADGSPAVDLHVTMGLQLEGAFLAALAVAALGLALVLVATWLWLRARRARRRHLEPGSAEPALAADPAEHEVRP